MQQEKANALKAELVRRELARRSFPHFMAYMHPEISMDSFHKTYYTILDRFAHGHVRKLIVTCPPQSGKALKIDTPVLTTNGFKKHIDLQEGDYVFGEDGLPKKVIRNFGAHYTHCQKITFTGDVSFITAREHEWEMYFEVDTHKHGKHVHEYKRKRVETQQLCVNEYRRNPYIYANAVVRNKTCCTLPIDPYLFGLWLGDGRKDQGKIAVGAQDINYFRSLPYDKTEKSVGDGNYTLLFHGLTSNLRKLGVLNNKHIPLQYLLASEVDRIALMQGIMDTDGCSDTKGRCELTQKEGKLADDMYVLLRTLGIKAVRHTYAATLYGKNCGNKVRISFSPFKGQHVFRLYRKQVNVNNKPTADRGDKHKFFLTSVQQHNDDWVNCIQVEGGMYLAGYDLVPTHNSEGSTRNLPAFLHGINPDLQICITSYGFPLAEKFNRAIKTNIGSKRYATLFPGTILPKTERSKELKGTYDPSVYANNARNYSLIGRKGGLIAVGRGGALTGNPVDIGIVDDLYKDDSEANSPLIRDSAWEWYIDVFATRLHNNSQQLITFTRWHEEDIIGRLRDTCTREGTPFIDITSLDQLKNCDPHSWYHVNFEAIKESEQTEIDPRPYGAVLWPARHNYTKLIEQRKLDPGRFQSLYQGNPMPREGLLYTKDFPTFKELSRDIRGRFLYCDVADQGSDYLVSLPFVRTRNNKLMFHDILYTQEGTEITERMVAEQIMRNNIKTAWIEANSGGRIFSRNVKKILADNKYNCYIYNVSQTANKESRILTNAVDVMEHCMFEEHWEVKYPDFYRDLKGFKKLFKANRHDDAPDALTAAVECTVLGKDVSALYRW